MKKIKNWIILLVLMMIACTCYSQNMPKITLKTPLDSVFISKRHLHAATYAFAELKYYKKMEWYHQEELHSKDIEIDFYKKGLNSALKANTLCDSINDKYIKLDNTSQIELAKYRVEIKKQKRAKLGASLGGIAGMVVTFITGTLIGHYLVK